MMSSEETTFAEEASKNMMKELQSWWEIPSVAQYISLFRECFHLPEIEIEELENGLIDDTIKGPNEWLQNLLLAFLKTIMPGRGVNVENLETFLRRLIRRIWPESPYAEKENPFEEDRPFYQLKLRSKVEVIYCCCLHRLDRHDITELMKSMDAEALRVQKLGVDDLGNTYWYFYGTRLYKEEGNKEKKTWDEEWKEQKRKSVKKKRGRGRPPKIRPRSDGESDFEDSHNISAGEYMNVNEKSRWSVVCDTIEEWVNFAERFKTSKSKAEKSLFQMIQENFLPTLNKIYEEKERKLQQKIRELMPAREKIVTRRETRRLRGEDVSYSPVNGYYSDDGYKTPVTKDRAQRLEERNKRASEADIIQVSSSRKRVKHDRQTDESSSSSLPDKSESNEIDLQSQMEKLLSRVKLHKDAWPFLYPVNEADAPGYYEIIKEPIDLSKIESRLFRSEYETVGDLDEDFTKMVANCELYNGEFHGYSKMAQTLQKLFRKELAKLLESFEVVESESTHEDSEGSNDSQYHSSSNSSSPPYESQEVSKGHKRTKSGKKKKKHTTEALDLLAQATDLAVQDSYVNRTSPQQKKSPVPQESSPEPLQLASKSMPCIPASTSSPTVIKTSKSVTSSSFISVNSIDQGTKKSRPVIVRAKASKVDKRTSVDNVSPTSFSTISSENVNNTVHSSNAYQSYNSKTVPVVISGYNSTTTSNQNDSRISNNNNNPVPAVTMHSNLCMPSGLPVVQQVMIPAGTQQMQIPNNGQFVFASPQNSVRLAQNMQVQNNIGQLNQGFAKVLPQIVASAPVMQVSKDGMQGLQFQTLSPNSTQAYAQVASSPQFVNIPYMVANQNSLGDSSTQSVMNFQPYQLSPRQMQIGGQGNG